MDATPLLFDLPPIDESPRGAIRAKILAFLEKPRSAREIATHIDRSVPNVTGHLRAARKLGLVVRVDWGRYVRADRCETAPDPATIRRPNSDQDLLLSVADRAESLDDLARLSGRTLRRVRHVAGRLRANGRALPGHLDAAALQAAE